MDSESFEGAGGVLSPHTKIQEQAVSSPKAEGRQWIPLITCSAADTETDPFQLKGSISTRTIVFSTEK